MTRIVIAALLPLLLASCGPSEEPARVIVGSSYLECAAREFLGNDESVGRLAEPGMCPGHFSLRPSQIAQLGNCEVVLRFEFQASLDRMIESGDGRPLITPIVIKGGLCEPASYIAACEQVAAALVQAELISQETADARLAAVGERMAELSQWARQAIREAGLTDEPVVASAHQQAFCEWLGLQVVAVLPTADMGTPREIEQAVQAARQRQCRLVAGNSAEGAAMAEKIGDSLEGGKVAVLDNFPLISTPPEDFDAMVRLNVQRLLEAARSESE